MQLIRCLALKILEKQALITYLQRDTNNSCSVGVHSNLILGSITNQMLVVKEDGVVHLPVGYDFYTIIIPDSTTTRKKKGQHKGHDK